MGISESGRVGEPAALREVGVLVPAELIPREHWLGAGTPWAVPMLIVPYFLWQTPQGYSTMHLPKWLESVPHALRSWLLTHQEGLQAVIEADVRIFDAHRRRWARTMTAVGWICAFVYEDGKIVRFR